jgi:hypothetical protein
MSQKSISDQLAEQTIKELNALDSTPSRKSLPHANFHQPALEKTQRQAASTTGYKASATWQTASLLRDLCVYWYENRPPVSSRNLPLDSRLKGQFLDALRSMVANIEEGWARPSTKELLDFLGFSQGSLVEARGDLERMHTDGLIIPTSDLRIPVPSRDFPYPPVSVRANPAKYGNLRDKLREYTGRNINPNLLSYTLFLELFNKTDYLMNRTVEGLQRKMATDANKHLEQTLGNIRSRYW